MMGAAAAPFVAAAGGSVLGGLAQGKSNQAKAEAAAEARRRQIAEQYGLQAEANEDSKRALAELDPNALLQAEYEAANGGAQPAIADAAAAMRAAGSGAGAAGEAAQTSSANQAEIRSRLSAAGKAKGKTEAKNSKWQRSRSRLQQIAAQRAANYDGEVEDAAAGAGNNWNLAAQLLGLGGTGAGAALSFMPRGATTGTVYDESSPGAGDITVKPGRV
jgi:hypothetical protein